MIYQSENIPNGSILNNNEQLHYVDSFSSTLVEGNFGINTIAYYFVTTSPKWADALMAFRNKIVALFGLKTAAPKTPNLSNPEDIKIEVGQQLGIFKVYEKMDQELLMGDDDKHLNFRVSILLNRQEGISTVSITTAVKYNNSWGKLYFFFVKPFHRLIVRSVLKQLVNKINLKYRKQL